jgi:hypothetical protein
VKAADSSDPLPVLTFKTIPCRNPHQQCHENIKSRITYSCMKSFLLQGNGSSYMDLFCQHLHSPSLVRWLLWKSSSNTSNRRQTFFFMIHILCCVLETRNIGNFNMVLFVQFFLYYAWF